MTDFQAAAPPLVLTPSERVLLFGDRFSKPAGMLGYSEIVLSSGAKVDADTLATNIVAAAFLANEQSGAIRLDLRAGKAMFGMVNTENLFAVPGHKQVGWPEGSLERTIAISVQAGPKVSDLVQGIIGQRSQSPAQALCGRAKHGLAQRGILHADVKTTLKIFTSVTYSLPDHVRYAAQQSGAAHVEQMLATTQQQRLQIWAQLTRNIKHAITFMTETND
jgi:hypothetical protein